MALTFHDLPVGDYMLLAEIDWSNPAQKENFVISAYGVEDVYFGGDIAAKIPLGNFLAQVYKASALSGEIKGLESSVVAQGLVSHRKHMEEGYIFIIFENKGHDNRYEVNLLFKPPSNIELCHPPGGSPEQKFRVSPGEAVIFIGKQCNIN